MSESDATPSDPQRVSSGFECAVLDADSAQLEVKGHRGAIIYVRLVNGALPSPLKNCLVEMKDSRYRATLHGRPEKDAFSPVAATLTMPTGRVYPVNLIAVLPSLGEMRPQIRSGLNPSPNIDSAAIPVALEPMHLIHEFRPTVGQLVSATEPIHDVAQLLETPPDILTRAESQMTQLGLRQVRRDALPADTVIIKLNHYQMLENVEAMELRLIERQEPETQIEALLAALTHEFGRIRYVAARALFPFAARLPVEPFLKAIEDKRELNSAACMLAARVFGEHADIVPPEVVVDLYHHARGSGVAETAIWAMGQYGDRAPVDLLANILEQGRAGIILAEIAAKSLGKLGPRAPITALLAEMRRYRGRGGSAESAARALLNHPGLDEVTAEDRALAERLVAAADERQAYVQRLREQSAES